MRVQHVGVSLDMTEVIFNDDELKVLFEKAILAPNRQEAKFIKCPSCGGEILMVPTLRLMNLAIENHVCKHKAALQASPIVQHKTAISIRLSLMRQVLKYIYCPHP